MFSVAQSCIVCNLTRKGVIVSRTEQPPPNWSLINFDSLVLGTDSKIRRLSFDFAQLSKLDG